MFTKRFAVLDIEFDKSSREKQPKKVKIDRLVATFFGLNWCK